MNMRTLRDLSSIGYKIEASMAIGSSDRDPQYILDSFDVESFDDITTEHPVVKKEIEKLTKHLENKEQTLSGGRWHLYLAHNDIGWTFLDIGYCVFEEKTEIVECKVKDKNGVEGKAFLKEVSAEKIENFKYYDVDGNLFEGEVLHSDSNVYFQLKRLEKKEQQ